MALRPIHLLLPAATAAALMAAAGPVDDIDAWWHVVVGDEIRSTGHVTGVGDSWASFDPEAPWTTSQWLAEVAMSWLVEVFGWSSLVWATLTLCLLVAAALFWSLSVNATPTVAAGLFAATILTLALFFQTRPALVTLIGAAVVGGSAARMLRGEPPPRWWLLVPAMALWSNLHGAWVVAPAALGLASVLQWLGDPAARLTQLRRGLLATAIATAAGCLNPLGFGSLLLPLTFSDSTGAIREWAPTQMWNLASLPLWVMLVAAAVGWLRSSERVPWAEVVYVGLWIALGWMAFRNVAVAAVIIAPVVAYRLSAGSGLGREPGPREHRILAASTIALSVGAVAWVIITAWRTDALEQAVPLDIARSLAADYDDVRVLNHYNTAGVLVAFGPPGIELGIDGRAERYGNEYRSDYLDLFTLTGDSWQQFFEEFDPEAVVVREDQALRHFVEDDLGWMQALRDGDFLLFEPPR